MGNRDNHSDHSSHRAEPATAPDTVADNDLANYLVEDEAAAWELATLTEREKRLVRLYTMGTVDEEAIRKESEDISRERGTLGQKLNLVRQPESMVGRNVGQGLLNSACTAVAQWLEQAGDTERVLALEALQIAVEATKDSAVISGILPVNAAEFIKKERSSQCLYSGE